MIEMNDSEELVPCPHSSSLENPLADGYVVHRVPRSELESNGGVCAQCRGKFRKHNLGALRGVHETPAEIEPRHEATLAEDHAAIVENGEVGSVEDFDWSSLGSLYDDVEEFDNRSLDMAAIALCKIFSWAFGRTNNVVAATRKLYVAALLLRPEMTNSGNLVELAAKLKVTKAATSKHAVNFARRFGRLNFRGQRSASARHLMAQAAKNHHASIGNGHGHGLTTHPGKDSL